MNATIAMDRQARNRALDPQTSFIVQAPAGAGKTELVVQRFLVLLARAGMPEEILAITFTRKAAGEMRDRILAALGSAAGGREPEEAHRRRTYELAREVLAADARHGWNLLDNPSRLRLQTIDSLCASLTHRAPVLAGFGAHAGIVEDAGHLYREAARETIDRIEAGEEWSDAIAHLLGHLDNDLPRVEGMIADMLARRDQWERHTHGTDRETLERTLGAVNREALAALRDAMPADVAGEVVELARHALANRPDVDGAIADRLRDGLPEPDIGALDAWRCIAGILVTAKGEWRKPKGLQARHGFPPPSKAQGEERARRTEMKERMGVLLERLAAEEGLRRCLAALADLPPPRYDDAQWRTIEAFGALLKLASGLLRVTFAGHGTVDFQGLSQGALAALGAEDGPTDLALLLDYRIRHILVDEFQDTSSMQYELLRRLTAGWERGDGRTLFLVGDPMQSIYRFREAEVGLYLRARREGIGDVALEALTLGVNHRSQAGIIDWVNAAFPLVLPGQEDLASGAVTYAPSHAHRDRLEGDAVTVHALIGDDREEPALVCRLVEEAFARDAGHRVAILVRARPHLAAIVPSLRAAGLRFRAVDIDPLAQRPVVQDLIALTFALTHLADRIAWLSVLRAPWCGLTLADLHALVGGDARRTVWELIQDGERIAALDSDGRVRLERLRTVFAHALGGRRRTGLRAWVEGVWIALGGPASCPAPADLDDARALFDVLEAFDAGGDLADRAGFLERIEALSARPDPGAGERLQLMTIHKAKGLEFDTVIVPGLGRGPRADQAQLLRWLQRPQGDVLLAPIQARGEDADPIYRYISGLDRAKGDNEDGRLLYVAATRARERLHLIGCAAIDEEGMPRAARATSLLGRLWPAVEPVYAAAARARADRGDVVAEAVPRPASGPPALRRFATDWRMPEPPLAVAWVRPERAPAPTPEPIEFAWAGETARHVGTVTHRLLQQCARAGINEAARLDVERIARAARAALRAAGMPEGDVEGAAQRVVSALRATLEDERGRWLLDPSHRDGRCEYALSTLRDGRLVRAIIDRTFIDDDGTRWIIDYKTGSHEGGGIEAFLDRERERYRVQLETYAELFRARDGHPVRLGLYFPLLRGWREWSEGKS